jgi:hypothetical protein
MTHRIVGAVAVAVLLAGTAGPARAQEERQVSAETKAAAKVAARIDQIINQRLAEAKIKPTPRADDSTFFRRLNLDLIGKIPELTKARDFLDIEHPEKRGLWIDEFLDSERYGFHFANFWRAIMLSGSTNQQQAQALQPQFEAWLKARLMSNTRYDKIAYELITSGVGGGVPGPGGGTPVAFFAANENKPENLAGASSRIFLGVKIECAQCHAHPFAKWSRTQFWEYAAFFAGSGPKGGANPNAREIRIPDSDKVVQAKFLTGEQPQWKPGANTRTTLADWMVSPNNPYFARAAVDHLWSYFFGVSLLEPILEPNDDSPPAHPALLDELARAFIASNYDLKFMIRVIVQTEAYQRSSEGKGNNKEEIFLFARMPVRALTPEQLFDSIAEATNYNTQNDMQPALRQFGDDVPRTPRQEFLSKFTTQDKRTELQTSILQALFMMNGKFVAQQTSVEKNTSLAQIIIQDTPHERRLESLYLWVLSRLPRPDETRHLVAFIEERARRGQQAEAIADIYWALLNSAEFMLNH